jgi:hypothetical protein
MNYKKNKFLFLYKNLYLSEKYFNKYSAFLLVQQAIIMIPIKFVRHAIQIV